MEELPREYFTNDAYKYVYPLAKTIGWTDDQIKEAINEYNKIEIKGSRAGTSLRMTISILLECYGEAELILMSYGIRYEEICPTFHSLPEILKVFLDKKVLPEDVDIIFGRVGDDFKKLLNGCEQI